MPHTKVIHLTFWECNKKLESLMTPEHSRHLMHICPDCNGDGADKMYGGRCKRCRGKGVVDRPFCRCRHPTLGDKVRS